MNGRPRPLVPKPVGNNSPWVMAIGAGFGAITLIGLFVFAYIAGENPKFVCSTFTLLAPIFALGCALSAGFIGGAAAANGQLGNRAQSNSLAFSAGGGVAVLFIAFFAFQNFKPECTAQAELHFRNFPITLQQISRDFWTKRHDDKEWSKSDLFVLVESDFKRGKLMFAGQRDGESGVPQCSIDILMTSDKNHKIEDDFPAVNLIEYALPGSLTALNFEYRHLKPGRGVKAVDPTCFTYNSRPVVEVIAFSNATKKIKFGQRYNPGYEREAFFNADPGATDIKEASYAIDLKHILIRPAFADSMKPAFLEIRDRLRSDNGTVQIATRQYLSRNFANYSSDVIADLSDQRQDVGSYYASLISALIAGIDSVAGQTLTPGPNRNLSVKLPYIGDKEGRIIGFTAHPSNEVKKQARRLVQRYPVDAFLNTYDPLIQSAAAGKCDELFSKEKSESVIYGAVFYYYNRILQQKYNKALKSTDLNKIDEISMLVQRGAKNCLGSDLVVDAALIEYGRAIVYSENGSSNLKNKATEAARSFMSYISGRDSDYYYQAHVDLMKEMSGT